MTFSLSRIHVIGNLFHRETVPPPLYSYHSRHTEGHRKDNELPSVVQYLY